MKKKKDPTTLTLQVLNEIKTKLSKKSKTQAKQALFLLLSLIESIKSDDAISIDLITCKFEILKLPLKIINFNNYSKAIHEIEKWIAAKGSYNIKEALDAKEIKIKSWKK